jgi:hypothetical protein
MYNIGKLDGSPLDFFTILTGVSGMMACTNPLVNIFAVLGLATDVSEFIAPDYTRSEDEGLQSCSYNNVARPETGNTSTYKYR